jgi:hypothetical protein
MRENIGYIGQKAQLAFWQQKAKKMSEMSELRKT